MLRSEALRHWLNHGQHLSAVALYRYELYTSQNAMGYALICLAFPVTHLTQGAKQSAYRLKVERVLGHRGTQVRDRPVDPPGAGQGTAQRRPRRRQVRPGQRRLVVVEQVPGQFPQDHVQPPAQELTLGLGLRLRPILQLRDVLYGRIAGLRLRTRELLQGRHSPVIDRRSESRGPSREIRAPHPIGKYDSQLAARLAEKVEFLGGAASPRRARCGDGSEDDALGPRRSRVGAKGAHRGSEVTGGARAPSDVEPHPIPGNRAPGEKSRPIAEDEIGNDAVT